MKILFVSAVLPYPLVSGGQVRIYQLLKKLSKIHDITLYTFIRSEKEKEYTKELSFCKKVVTVMRGRAWQPRYLIQTLFSRFPFLYQTYNNSLMRTLLGEELQNGYDLIHLEPGYVWLSLPKTDTPVVVSEHNIEHDVYLKYVNHFKIPFFRPFLRLDVAKMNTWERHIWKLVRGVTAVSESDKTHMANVVGAGKVTVVPNGVDTAVFLYVGAFSWIQNTDAASHLLIDIWPAIQAKYPEASLRIVGKNPPEKLKKMARGNVEFAGFVQDIHAEYTSADIFLAPIRVGGGTKYKILESMASGLSVVTTEVGARGIENSNEALWISETPKEMLEAIGDIMHKDRLEKLKKARRLVEQKYSWEHIAEILDSVWKSTYEKNN
jgi:polysaccharide biosynthesis protein PslH